MTLAHYLTVSTILFLIGVFGVLSRRNIIGILMSIELMFNAANLNFVAFNRFLHVGTPSSPALVGQIVTLFTITIAAAEIVVGLALILAIYRNLQTIYVEDFNILKG